MHELGIATEIYLECRARLASERPCRLESVRVAIGELSAVEPDLLRYAWEAVTADGPDSGATLDIRWCPARQVCVTCETQVERVPGAWLDRCPRCGRGLSIEGGRDLDLVECSYLPLLEETA